MVQDPSEEVLKHYYLDETERCPHYPHRLLCVGS